MDNINEIKDLIISALRSIIIKEDLINTGALRDNIDVDVQDENISIFTMDYYIYLDEKYQLTNQLNSNSDFIRAIDLFTDMIAEKRLQEITKDF